MKKRIKNRIIFILISALIISSFSGFERRVSADTGDIINPVYDHDPDYDQDYVEGDVIVCVRESNDDKNSYSLRKSVTRGLNSLFSFDPATLLLDQAEELMDVTEAVEDEEILENNEDTSDDTLDTEENSIPLLDSLLSYFGFDTNASAEADDGTSDNDDTYTLKYIHSDSYTTRQMIETLKDNDRVLFAEPNYICHLAEDEMDETDILTEDDSEAYIYTTDSEDIVVDEPVVSVDEEDKTVEDVVENDTYEEDISSDEILTVDTGDDANEEEVPEDDTEEENGVTTPDLTDLQYAYGIGPGGIDVPNWNDAGHSNVNDDVVVAVVDSGVDYNHEDLNMWDEGLNYDALKTLGGGMYGFNATDPDNTDDPMDDNLHGTHCAGIIGAKWNNYGISGAANGVKIMAIKVFNSKGGGKISWVLNGFNYLINAKRSGVNIVAGNCSFGGPISYTAVWKLGYDMIVKNDIVVCRASCNASSNSDHIYNDGSIDRENDGFINVNSNNKEGLKSDFSNFGVRTTDVYAPGTEIVSTIPMGTGIPFVEKCNPVKDKNGRDAGDTFNDENTYFTYTCSDGVRIERCEDRGRMSLKVEVDKSNGEEYGILTLSGNELGCVPSHLLINARGDKVASSAIAAHIKTSDGDEISIYPEEYLKTEYSNTNSCLLPENMDIVNPSIRLEIFDDAYISDIFLVDSDGSNYCYLSGTSMSTPAVTGEVAVLASEWPEDSVYRRAARVIGSTKYNDQLNGTCRTDGIINVRKALACDYSPVVNRAEIDDNGLIHVYGYFFGEGAGSISVEYNGRSYQGTVEEWHGQSKELWSSGGENDEDVIVFTPVSDCITDDAVKISITSADGKSGSRMLTIDGAGKAIVNKHLYDKLPLPGEDSDIYDYFYSNIFLCSAGLDKTIYLCGYTEVDGYSSTFKYVPSADGEDGNWDILKNPIPVWNISNVCVFDNKLIWMSPADLHIWTYSPEDDEPYDTGLEINDEDEDSILTCSYMVNTGSSLYLLGSVQKEDDNRTDLYKIDIDNSTSELIYTLKTIQSAPVLSAKDDKKGNAIVYAMSKKDETTIACEEISIPVSGEVTSEAFDLALPDNCTFNNNRLVGAENKYGIILAGFTDNDKGTDNFFFSWEDRSIKPCKRQMAAGTPYVQSVTEFKGKTYFLCYDQYSETGMTFACVDDEEFAGMRPTPPTPTPNPTPSPSPTPTPTGTPTSTPTPTPTPETSTVTYSIPVERMDVAGGITARVTSKRKDLKLSVARSSGALINTYISGYGSLRDPDSALYYDIKLTDENGNKVDDDAFEKCTITFSLPADMDIDEGRVDIVSIRSLDNSLDVSVPHREYKVNGVSYTEIDAYHFSEYAILYHKNRKNTDSSSTSGSSSGSDSGSSSGSSTSYVSDILTKDAKSNANTNAASGTINSTASNKSDDDRKLDNIPKTGDR